MNNFSMSPLQKVALFLILVGPDKGQSVIALMDNGEIKAVVAEIQKLAAISPETQRGIWAEFYDLGYEDSMNPAETLTIIRFLFDGRKIGR